MIKQKIVPGKHPIYFKADTVLVPVMFGGSYNQKINEEFSLNGKLFLVLVLLIPPPVGIMAALTISTVNLNQSQI
ncbi:hypothetical protein AGMMS49921_06070 [Endomicrobiia bacterium]|nr:hypothetical protein AGMMS49921_06070 [Endomicrobiia bacterium]